jgi:choline dehydrogenase-like flavoprotein
MSAVHGYRPAGPRYQTREEVDFVIVGSGAAGGILAAELSEAGFEVVVLEQGPYVRPHQFTHDEVDVWVAGELTGSTADFPQTFRASEDVEATPQPLIPPAYYARMVGGSSVHFTANFWRFKPLDFRERSLLGPIGGTGLADWPITYEELEPYYTRVDWEIGVSGAPGPFDPPRSRPYPVPPLPVKSSGVLLEQGARALGLRPFAAPMAILSEIHDDRAACVHCGFCMGYGCEVGAKSSTLAAMIPRAEATGRCEIRPESTVFRVDLDERGRVREVLYLDAEGVEHAQRARAVILAANGAETARLLLASESSAFPDGLANSSGKVGKYLMFNGQTAATGTFEHPLNEFKGPQVTRILWDWYESDPQRGFYGGGGMDGRQPWGPALFPVFSKPAGTPSFGSAYKRWVMEAYTRTMDIAVHTTSLPLESNNVSLDPTVKDKWGRPSLRVTYRDHDDDLATMGFLQARAVEILEAAGARQTWQLPIQPQVLGAHLLGTCRMGSAAGASVVDASHRAHDVPNLFICDGSSLVTSGRGQPTMTIMALAFRAAEHIGQFARRGEI